MLFPYSRCYFHILTETFACLHDCIIELVVILPCKTRTKTCWFFPSLLKRFLQALALFVFLKYNDVFNHYSIWYLKKYWVRRFISGEFAEGKSSGRKFVGGGEDLTGGNSPRNSSGGILLVNFVNNNHRISVVFIWIGIIMTALTKITSWVETKFLWHSIHVIHSIHWSCDWLTNCWLAIQYMCKKMVLHYW